MDGINNGQNNRSIFLKGESYTDVMAALSKAESPEELKRLIWERMKKNGCTRESEIEFRRHCQIVGFSLPGETKQAKPVAEDKARRSKSRVLLDAAKNQFRQARIVGDVEAIENE